MNVPDEQLDELVAIFTTFENGAVEAGAISFADAVEGALPAALDRHEQMVLNGIDLRVWRTFHQANESGMKLDAMTVNELTQVVVNAIRGGS